MPQTGPYPQLQKFPQLERSLKYTAIVLTVVVLLLVGLMRSYKLPVDVDLSFLPAVNAALNSLTAIVLLVSLYMIKQGKIIAHRNANVLALALSVLFLLGYVAYHFTTPETIYGDADGDGLLSDAEKLAVAGSRSWYYLILFSHIVLAGLSLPFILFTTIFAVSGKYTAHRKLARIVWPVWFYVAITGPIVYLMLQKYY